MKTVKKVSGKVVSKKAVSKSSSKSKSSIFSKKPIVKAKPVVPTIKYKGKTYNQM